MTSSLSRGTSGQVTHDPARSRRPIPLRNPLECTLIAAIVLAAWGRGIWVWEVMPWNR